MWLRLGAVSALYGCINLLLVVERSESARELTAALSSLGHELVLVRPSDALPATWQAAECALTVRVLSSEAQQRGRVELELERHALPVLFLAEPGSELDAARAHALGASDFLAAPWPPEVLRTKVELFVTLFQLRRAGERADSARTAPLQDDEARFRQLIDVSDEGFCIIEVLFDEGGRAVDHRFLELNPAFEKQSGLPNAKGKTMLEIAPDHDSRSFDIYGRVALSGEPVRFVHQSKERVLKDRWFDIRASRLGGPESRKVAAMFSDITERVQAEEALRETKVRLSATLARLEFALKAGRMGTWELNVETEELVCSDACKANYGRAAHEPFTYGDLALSVADDDRVRWRKVVEDAVLRVIDFELEYRVHWPDDTQHWVYVRASWTQAEPDQPRILSGVSLNIDERKRIEEDLLAADRRKDEFLATASHELRTPLNAILGWARLLRAGQLDASGYLRGVETIERNAKAQVQLIEDILDGSRIITGKLQLEIRPLDMTALVYAAVDAIRPAAEAKKIELRVVVDPAAARIAGDPDRLQQVVWNLANNAIKFTPKAGLVEIRLERVGTGIELVVKDNGQGIRPDFLAHVFERFRQAEGSTTRRHGGLGLGLALVRHLVEAHGGTVRAESEGEGRGATFVVTLPVQAVFAEPASTARITPIPSGHWPSSTNLHGVSVLIVDDQADARELIATVLRASGARVTTAASAKHALELVTSSRPMILLSDIGMPEVDGYELIRRLRAQCGAVRIPAIALTAYAREEDRRLALDAGFDSHVAKPVEPVELLAVVGRLVKHEDRVPGKPEIEGVQARAETFHKLQKLLETQGIHEALRFLNSRTPHRFTGVYRFDPPLLRNLHLIDSYLPECEKGDDPPLNESYCSLVGQTEQTFTTEDARRDDRLRDHPARGNVLSYCGVLLRDATGRPLGTLCHFDLVPCDIPTLELGLMEVAAPLIVGALTWPAA